MTCYHPIKCLFDGVNKPLFHPSYKDYELSQTYYRFAYDKIKEYTCIAVGCGKCVGCGYDHSKKWIMRLSAELLTKPPGYRSCFVTLTYDDDHVPLTRDGLPTLRYSDVSDFIKRVRRYYEYHSDLGVKLDKFFYVGEYGDQTKRPHYHLILFGIDFREIWDLYLAHEHKRLVGYDVKKPIRRCGKPGCGSYEINTLSRSWNKGYALVGNCTNKSIAYCSGYMVPRKAKQLKMNEYYGSRVPEKSIMSNGIAYDFYQKYKEQIFNNDFFHINDYSYSPDKTFKAWLKEDNPELYEKYKQKVLSYVATPSYIVKHSEANLRAAELIALQKYQKWLKPEEFVQFFGKEGENSSDFELPE